MAKSPNPKELTCDEYISFLEEQLSSLKQVRQSFLLKKISPPVYEEKTMTVLRQLQNGLDGVRHTFLPLVIPTYFQISTTPPSWITLTKSQDAEYANYSLQNDAEQKEMLRRFRRPGMRRADIQRAALLLNNQQNKVLEQMKWSQSNYAASILANSLRTKISPVDSYPTSLLKEIKSYINENGLDFPIDDDSTCLLLISLFEEEGPLSAGISNMNSISQEIATIAAVLSKLGNGFPVDKLISFVKPYIADIHHEQLLSPLAKKGITKKIDQSLKEAIDILGSDATMADFGTEGVVSLLVSEGLKKCMKNNKVDNLIARFQEVGNSALEGAPSKTAAANMIATVLIAQKLVNVPLNFMYAVSWCSDLELASFTNQPIYIQAFDALIHVLPDFGE